MNFQLWISVNRLSNNRAQIYMEGSKLDLVATPEATY